MKAKINETLGWTCASFWVVIVIVNTIRWMENPANGWMPPDAAYLYIVGVPSFVMFIAQIRKTVRSSKN